MSNNNSGLLKAGKMILSKDKIVNTEWTYLIIECQPTLNETHILILYDITNKEKVVVPFDTQEYNDLDIKGSFSSKTEHWELIVTRQ